MRGETEYFRKQQHSGGVQDDEYLSDMSIKVFIEYLYEDKMSLYMRQRPKIRDYTEVTHNKQLRAVRDMTDSKAGGVTDSTDMLSELP